MQMNLLWQGLLHPSLENCLVATGGAGAEADSVIIGLFDHKIYRTEYLIRTNRSWETVSFKIRSQAANGISYFKGQRGDKGSWTVNGQRIEECNGCMDIDISLTPFTNTLPINRLKLPENESRVIDVLYIDVLAQRLTRMQQRYTRLSGAEYRYENVPNDFEAVLSVDEAGFVTHYPPLFVRRAAAAGSC